MRSTVTAVACAVLGTLGLLAIPASGAGAAAPGSLTQLTSFHQMVVDSAGGHIFLSEGVRSDQLLAAPDSAAAIIVTDLSGDYVTTLDAGHGVEGLALSADGSVLYAALATEGVVDVISTATLTSTTQYSLGTTQDTPYGLAIQSSKLWVSYNGSAAGMAAVGDFDLTVTSPTFETQANMGGWYSAPDLAADPGGSGVLVAAQPGLSPANAATYSTTADPVTAIASMAALGNGNTGTECDNEAQVTVVPGGSQFIASCAVPAGANVYTTTNLSAPVSVYTSTLRTNAVTVNANGIVATGASNTTINPASVDIYQSDGTLLNVFSLGTSQLTARAGLAWSADGTELFAVLQNGTSFSVATYSNPTVTVSLLTLSGPATALLGSGIALNGSLTLSNGAALPANTSVSLTTTAPDNSKSTQAIQPGSDGTFTVPDDRTQAGTYTYAASYAGDTGIAPATTQISVTATQTTSNLTLSGPSSTIIDNNLALKGSLTLGNGDPLPPGTQVTITRTAPDKTQTALPPQQPGSNGGFTVTDAPNEVGTYTYAAAYAGTIGIAPASKTITVKVTLNPATFALSGPSVVTYGKNVVVNGTLILGVGQPAAGTMVTVVRTPAGSTVTKTFPLKLNAGGGFTLTDPKPAKGRYTYTFTYAGNATTAKAKAALTVTVARTTPTLQLITSSPNYVFGTRIRVTAALGATFADRTVSIYAKPAGQPATLLETGTVNASGDLSVSYLLARSTVFSAVFAGDVHNAPVTVTRGVGAFVKVVMSNSGYFKTVTIRGIGFRVYHHTGHLNTAITVTPNKHGQCVDLEVQQWDSQIGWFPNATIGCYTLSSVSKISTYLTLLGAGGAEYRMRADYVRSSSDTTNINTDGSWFYFEVVK